MTKLEVSAYSDAASARTEVKTFLEKHYPVPECIDWERRMRFWWDENPAAQEDCERGRWVRAGGRGVGFGGSIPILYAWQGMPIVTFAATTLCVDPNCPRAAALMFLKQRVVAERNLIAHTTPNPRIQEALRKMGARSHTTIARHFFAAGTGSWLRGRSSWPSLSPAKYVVTSPDEVLSVKRSYRNKDRLEKWITPEYLRWFCSSPMRPHHFVGATDAQGMLSSYLLVTPRRVKGLRSWDVIEAFTTEDDEVELLGLIGLLVKEPALLPGGAALVTGTAFPGDHTWDHCPALLRRNQQVCHFFLMPESLRDVPKHTVMAEGDLGL
jgi:hypothetical protein